MTDSKSEGSVYVFAKKLFRVRPILICALLTTALTDRAGCQTLERTVESTSLDGLSRNIATNPSTVSEYPRVIEQDKPEELVFRKLNGLGLKGGFSQSQNQLLENSEQKMADKFRFLVNGKTATEIAQMVGVPWLSGGDSVLELSKSNGEEHSIYLFGKTPIFVRLTFKEGVCTDGWTSSYSKDPWYSKWRRSEIARFAIGKTVKNIVAAEGMPSEVTRTIGSSLTTEENNVFFKHQHLKNGCLVYRTGQHEFSLLKIVDDVCTEVGGDFRTGSVDNAFAVFKMP